MTTSCALWPFKPLQPRQGTGLRDGTRYRAHNSTRGPRDMEDTGILQQTAVTGILQA